MPAGALPVIYSQGDAQPGTILEIINIFVTTKWYTLYNCFSSIERLVNGLLNILIVEDEQAINELIYVNLSDEGYCCTRAYDGKEAADLIENNDYDLILLDIMLPKINGYELMDYIRPLGTPVIFITAKTDINDRIRGLKLGADDYISKPFQVGELLARVEAVLRRFGKSERKIELYGVTIDLNSREVWKDGELIELTVKEFELLIKLIQNKNVALRRSWLYERVWESEFTGETRTLDTHIQRLRKKLEWEDRIKTVFRIGYRLEV